MVIKHTLRDPPAATFDFTLFFLFVSLLSLFFNLVRSFFLFSSFSPFSSQIHKNKKQKESRNRLFFLCSSLQASDLPSSSFFLPFSLSHLRPIKKKKKEEKKKEKQTFLSLFFAASISSFFFSFFFIYPCFSLLFSSFFPCFSRRPMEIFKIHRKPQLKKKTNRSESEIQKKIK